MERRLCASYVTNWHEKWNFDEKAREKKEQEQRQQHQIVQCE